MIMTQEQLQRFDEALERLGGDQDMLAMLAAIVAEDAPPMLAKLGEDVTAGDSADYAKVAHALKGMLSTFETGEPVSDLQSVINAARDNHGREVQKLHVALSPQLKTLILEIEAIS